MFDCAPVFCLPACFSPSGWFMFFICFILLLKKPWFPLHLSPRPHLSWQNGSAKMRTQQRRGLGRPPPDTISSPLYQRILQYEALSSCRQQGNDVRSFAVEFSGAAEGLGYNDEALKDLFNSALDEPLSWWRMSGLDHLTFGEFVEALARSPAKVAGVPQVVGDKAAAPPVAADGAAVPLMAAVKAAAHPGMPRLVRKLEDSPMRSVRAADFSPTKPSPVVLEAMVESACSAPEPAPIREPTESAPEPAPIREPTYSTPEPAPIREPKESAPEPAPIREPKESAPEPAPIREPTEPAPIREPTHSAPGAHAFRSDPGAHAFRSDPGAHAFRSDPRAHAFRSDPRAHGVRSDPRAHGVRSRARSDPGAHAFRSGPGAHVFRSRALSDPGAHGVHSSPGPHSVPGAHRVRSRACSAPGAHAVRSVPGAHAVRSRARSAPWAHGVRSRARSDPRAHGVHSRVRSDPGAQGVRSRARSAPWAHGVRSRARSDPRAHGVHSRVRSDPGAQGVRSRARSDPGAHTFRSGPGPRSGLGTHRAHSRASPTLAPLCAHCSRPSSTPRAWPTSLLDIFLFSVCGASGIRSLKGGLCHGPAGVPRLATRCLCVLSTWLVVCLVPCAPMSIVCPLPSCYVIIVSVAPAVSPYIVSLCLQSCADPLSFVCLMWVKCLTVLQSSACLLVFPLRGGLCSSFVSFYYYKTLISSAFESSTSSLVTAHLLLEHVTLVFHPVMLRYTLLCSIPAYLCLILWGEEHYQHICFWTKFFDYHPVGKNGHKKYLFLIIKTYSIH